MLGTMSKCRVCLLFFINVLVFLGLCECIILANKDPPKPAYTSGIKTTGWRNPNNIQTHQNYSKVYIHNNPNDTTEYVITKVEKSEKVYPIYNAHSYGQQPEQTQRIVEANTRRNHTEGFPTVVGGSTAGTRKNRTIYKRKIEYKAIEVYEKCPKGATGSFVYYLNCNQFLNCWKGRGEVQNCAPGTLFNPRTLECDFPSKVECVTGLGELNSLSLQSIRGQKSIAQATCLKEFSGLIPNYTDCSKFISCNNGQQTSMDCPPGTLFDTNLNVCNFPHLTTCFNGQSGDLQGSSSFAQGSQSQHSYQYGVNQYGVQGQGSQSQQGYQYGVNQYGGQGQASQLGQGHHQQGNNQDQYQRQHGSSFHGSNRFDTQNQGSSFGQQGTQHVYHHGHGFHGTQGQEGQTGSHHYQTVQSQTFQGQACNPQTQVCGYPSSQGQQSFGSQSSVGVNHGQSTYQTNEGQYVAGSHTGQQSVDSKLDFNEGSGSSTQQTGGRGHRILVQTPQTTAGCNPQIQNCGQVYGFQGHGQSAIPVCDPSIQNCGQSYPSNQGQGHGQTSVTPCNPAVQNCVGVYGNIHQTTSSHSSGPTCDPRTHNCSPTYVTHVYGSGQGQSGQGCNPQDQRCVQGHGGSHQTTSHGYSQGSGGGQQNYHKVCNINDPSCRRNRTATTKKNISPKCPDGFQGITKHPTDCKKFLNCANGRTFIQDCAPGTLFNPAIGNCDFPYNVKCSNSEGDDTTTENYESSTEDEWQETYNQHAQQYGQNAGQGNIRASTTGRPVDQTYHGSYDQGHTQYYGRDHTQNQGQGSYNGQSSHGSSYGTAQEQGGYYGHYVPTQGQTTYDQSQSNQNHRPHSTGGVKTGQGSYNQRPPTNQGGGVTIISHFTPRPTPAAYVPRETVINRGQVGLVSRPTENIIDVSNKRNNGQDYVDVFNPNEGNTISGHSTTPRSAGRWPPPFPATDVNADYVFEYEDGEPVTLDVENVFHADSNKKKKADCNKSDFYCSVDTCITKSAVCDGHRDCQNGKDEVDCQEYVKKFGLSKNSQLNILEDQRWMNVSQATCALLCLRSTSFVCRSFNYRNIDKICFLSTLNVGLTGALRQYYPYDYYELKSASIDCTLMFKCNNNKCLSSRQVCDGFADCADREDEKNCKPEDFGYSIKLAGTNKDNEGRVEVTAFGKTGYICDDQFGIKDANVICRELGFQLGAAEVKGNSFYATDIKEKNTLYMIDDLDCLGNETTLIDCSFPGWGIHNCRNQEIAGLVCKTPQEKCGTGTWKCNSGNECIPYHFVCDGLFDCTDDSDESAQNCDAPTELRLANGTDRRRGRVEIKHHGIWGTICDDDFNEDAAKVVCRILGFKGTSILKKEGFFGPGEGPIWLDQVSCYGNETDLRDCTQWNWGEHNCDHTEDVGVICSNDVEEVQLQRHSKIEDKARTNAPMRSISCGFRKDNQFLENDLIHARVVGGSVARKGDYPWQAALRIKGKAQVSHHWCGAVILSSKWVLTAAHCLLGYAKGAYMIVAGEYNTDEDEGTEQTKYVEEYFLHHNFTERERVMKNDIALIKVKGVGFTLNDDVQPICLPEVGVDYERELNCTISGFGSVKTGNSAYSHNLMAAWVPLIKSDICKMPHIYDTALSEGMICAGFLNGGVDSCHGDSGGPLACLDNGLFTLYGLTSWGHRCGFANKPGVYVKVAHYRQWIDDTINNNS